MHESWSNDGRMCMDDLINISIFHTSPQKYCMKCSSLGAAPIRIALQSNRAFVWRFSKVVVFGVHVTLFSNLFRQLKDVLRITSNNSWSVTSSVWGHQCASAQDSMQLSMDAWNCSGLIWCKGSIPQLYRWTQWQADETLCVANFTVQWRTGYIIAWHLLRLVMHVLYRRHCHVERSYRYSSRWVVGNSRCRWMSVCRPYDLYVCKYRTLSWYGHRSNRCRFWCNFPGSSDL